MRRVLPAVSHVVSLLALVARAAGAQSTDDLRAITMRGRELAAYQIALDGALDAMHRLGAPDSCAERYIVRRGERGFVVRFGHWSAARDTFLVSFEATQRNNPEDFALEPIRPERAASADERADVVALERSARELGKRRRPMRGVVVPATGGTRWVYWLPAQTRVGIWPHGDDVRFLVSADGGGVLDKHRMHDDYLDVLLPVDATYGAHDAMSDVPEDTDIMLVLLRHPAVPEIISAHGRIYYVAIDGTIAVGQQR
jgi:hypothetical protein